MEFVNMVMVVGAPGSLNIYGQARERQRPARPDAGEARRAQKEAIRRAAARLYAERGPDGVSRRQLAVVAQMHHSVLDQIYLSEADVLGDVLAEFVYGLAGRVCGAFDAGDMLGPLGRLEAVIRAWLDCQAMDWEACRAFLFCRGRLEEPYRSVVSGKYQVSVDTLAEALSLAVPGLETVPEGLMESGLALLSGPGDWAQAPRTDEQGRRARRIAGMLVEAGEAEASGSWCRFGPVEGIGEHGKRVVECAEARARLGDLLDYVAAGGEVTVRRWGKPAGRVVGVGRV